MSHELMSPAEYQLHQLAEWLKGNPTSTATCFIEPPGTVTPGTFCVSIDMGRLFGFGSTIADAIADALQKVK